MTSSAYDKLNRVSSVQNAVGAVTYYAYDAVGNRISVQDPLNRFNYFYYDSLNRLQVSEDGLQKQTYYTYDAWATRSRSRTPAWGLRWVSSTSLTCRRLPGACRRASDK